MLRDMSICLSVFLMCQVNIPQKVEPYLGLGLLATKSITEVQVGGTEEQAPQTLKKMPSLAFPLSPHGRVFLET